MKTKLVILEEFHDLFLTKLTDCEIERLYLDTLADGEIITKEIRESITLGNHQPMLVSQTKKDVLPRVKRDIEYFKKILGIVEKMICEMKQTIKEG